jgi:hypothetical protein
MSSVEQKGTNAGDIVLIWCYRGYRPATVKEIGKRQTRVAWADGTMEWVENKRVRTADNLIDRAWMERALREEKGILSHEGKNDE